MTFAAYGAIALVALPTLVLLVEIVAALLPARRRVAPGRGAARVAVLVPAHDEAAGIAATLATIAPQLGPGDRLLVVADNCGDATAAVARAAGAEVYERVDVARRGKSYALAAGVAHLAADAPDVVIIVDADCRVEEGAVAALRAAATTRPVQAVYLMRAPDAAPPARRLAELLFLIRNLVRPRGLLRLGLPCVLTGSGMAFPWALLRDAPLGSGSVVEDLQLAVDLAAAGAAPELCPQARVLSWFPRADAAAAAQQARWSWGVVHTIAQVPRLIAAALRQRQPSLLALAAEVAVPPMALLFALWTLVTAAAAALWWWRGDPGPLLAAAAGGGACALGVVVAWARFARDRVPFSALLCAPLYALPALGAALGALLRRHQDWNRTTRD